MEIYTAGIAYHKLTFVGPELINFDLTFFFFHVGFVDRTSPRKEYQLQKLDESATILLHFRPVHSFKNGIFTFVFAYRYLNVYSDILVRLD